MPRSSTAGLEDMISSAGKSDLMNTAYNKAKSLYKKAKSTAKKYAGEEERSCRAGAGHLDSGYNTRRNVETLVDKLRDFYRVYDPEKDNDAVRRQAQWHDGNEDQVNRELRTEYGADLTDLDGAGRVGGQREVEKSRSRSVSKAQESESESESEEEAPKLKQRFKINIGGGITAAKSAKSPGGGKKKASTKKKAAESELMGFGGGGGDDPFATGGDGGDPFAPRGGCSGGGGVVVDPFQASTNDSEDEDDFGFDTKPMAAKSKPRFQVKIKDGSSGGVSKGTKGARADPFQQQQVQAVPKGVHADEFDFFPGDAAGAPTAVVQFGAAAPLKNQLNDLFAGPPGGCVQGGMGNMSLSGGGGGMMQQHHQQGMMGQQQGMMGRPQGGMLIPPQHQQPMQQHSGSGIMMGQGPGGAGIMIGQGPGGAGMPGMGMQQQHGLMRPNATPSAMLQPQQALGIGMQQQQQQQQQQRGGGGTLATGGTLSPPKMEAMSEHEKRKMTSKFGGLAVDFGI